MDGSTWVGVGMAALGFSGIVIAGILRFAPVRQSNSVQRPGASETCVSRGKRIREVEVQTARLEESTKAIIETLKRIETKVDHLGES